MKILSNLRFYDESYDSTNTVISLISLGTDPTHPPQIPKQQNKAPLSFVRTSLEIMCAVFVGWLYNVIFNQKYFSSVSLREYRNTGPTSNTYHCKKFTTLIRYISLLRNNTIWRHAWYPRFCSSRAAYRDDWSENYIYI